MLERTVPKMKGLATGIGSLPHKDAGEALDLVFKYLPAIPFWPQLPKRSPAEGMVAQFSEHLPCFSFSEDGVFFNPRDKEGQLEAFYGQLISENTDYFKISADFAQGLYEFYHRLEKAGTGGIRAIKCQITGPFTFAAAVTDAEGRSLLHDPVFMQVITKGLAMKALWQIELFKKFGKDIIVFIDEPFLGCFGSAYTPVNREEVVKALREVTQAIGARGVFCGVHCCGNTDWSIFTEVEGIDIISFDAFSFLEKFILYPQELQKFLRRGGVICWGIVPTQGLPAEDSLDLLAKRLKEGIDLLVKKGIDRKLTTDNLLLSPACGLGMLNTQEAEKIFGLLKRLSDLTVKGL